MPGFFVTTVQQDKGGVPAALSTHGLTCYAAPPITTGSLRRPDRRRFMTSGRAAREAAMPVRPWPGRVASHRDGAVPVVLAEARKIVRIGYLAETSSPPGA